MQSVAKISTFLTKPIRLSIPLDTFSILSALKYAQKYQTDPTTIQHLHSHIVKLGFDSDSPIANSLLHSYFSASSVVGACQLFDEMPDRRTVVTWNTMISGFSRNGNVEKARAVFEEMPMRDISSWNAMIAGYMKTGRHEAALSLFRDMVMMDEEQGVRAGQVTAVVVLSGCAQLGGVGLLMGKSMHGFAVKNKWEKRAELGTVLIDMYAKCGFMKGAERVFETMQERNVMAWSALISGFSQHGYNEKALSLFERMQDAGIRPNEQTFTGALSACANSGLVEKGREIFNLVELSGLSVRIEHCGCMVDLFGKAGMLEEAYEFINNMRLKPDVTVWGAFLSGCKEHKKFEMAERVVDTVMKMVNPENDRGVYSLISDLYVLGGKWDDAQRVRSFMVKHNVKKVRGSSFV